MRAAGGSGRRGGEQRFEKGVEGDETRGGEVPCKYRPKVFAVIVCAPYAAAMHPRRQYMRPVPS